MDRDEVESPNRSETIVGLGELIWDLLPEGKQLGGAPSNFAYISHLLGDTSVVASRTGDDALGREARRRLDTCGVSTRYLQLDPEHPTGTVGVVIDATGEPRFSVNENSAWDYLAWTPAWAQLASQADAVCYGTLGQRHTAARETILRFLSLTRPDALRVFDVNLRHAFFTASMLAASLQLANVVKLNDDELAAAAQMLDIDTQDSVALCRRLLDGFGLDLVAVTRGAHGSLLVSREDAVEHRGFRVPVVDTIGAGDAFAATLVHFYRRRAPLRVVAEAANRVASWIVTQSGATPAIDPRALTEMLDNLT